MNWLRWVLFVTVVGLLGAGPLLIQRDVGTCPGAVCSAATGLDSAQYTGWIHVGDRATVTLELTFVDGNDSVTALTTTCQTSDLKATANGAGYDVCSVGVAGGAGTRVCPYVDSITTGTAEKFSQEWTDLPHAYVNCHYTATGTPAAADTLLVGVKRRTPW